MLALHRTRPFVSARLRQARTIAQSRGNAHNPFRSSVPTDELGLPLQPQPVPIPSTASTTIASADLERLHRLSALNPPTVGSQEEADLLKGLNELVGLMEVVQNVELPEGEGAIGELLTQGVGEVTIGERTGEQRDPGKTQGRDLLEWATSRKGDYYHTKTGKKV